MTETTPIKKNKFLTWLPWVLIVLITAYAIWSYQNYLAIKSQLSGDQVKLQEQLNQLTLDNQKLLTEKQKYFYLSDSLNSELQPYLPMKALMLSVQMRNFVKNELPFKPGDIVKFKSDSLNYVIQDLVIGGNTYSYYVKYRIRRGSNLPIECDIEELEPSK
jgi:hypothetical protein